MLGHEERFVYQVKQVNELIERFNGDNKTLLKSYTNEHSLGASINRSALIKTLFDTQRKDWNITEVKSFIEFVDNKNTPIYLHFSDDEWFAEVNCLISYNGVKDKVVLVLKVQKERNDALKWVMVSAKAPFLAGERLKNFKGFHKSANNINSLNPISHATEFMNLDLALNDHENILNYIANDCNNNELLFFMEEYSKGKIKFEQVNSITYHFLQINGWTFTVKKFRRPIKNSGWLVNNLIRMSADDKKKYLASVLNINR
jgi:hypothetical protein